MADKKISALTSASTPLAGTEVLPIVQSGATVKASVENVLTSAQPSGTANSLQYLNASKISSTTTAPTYDGKTLTVIGAAGNYGLNIAARTDFSVLSGQFLVTDSSGSFCIYTNNGAVTFATGATVGTNGGTERLNLSTGGNLSLSTGNLVIGTSGKGIDFSATPGTGTSELFADYEEGTFSAVISDGTTDATMGFNTCQYTKVGRQVTVCGYISTTDITGLTGNLLLKGLPFAIASGLSYFSAGSIGSGGGLNILVNQVISMYGVGGSATADIRIWDALTGTTGLTPAEWSADGNMVFSLTYFA